MEGDGSGKPSVPGWQGRYDLRTLFEASTMGLAVTLMDGTLVEVNPAFARILGRTVEECRGLRYWEITPEAHAIRQREQIETLMHTGRYGPFEKEYIHKDGHAVPVRLSGVLMEQGGERFVWSSVEDITQRKEAEAAIQNERDFSNAVLDSLPGVLYCYDETLSFRRWNQNFERVTGYTAAEVARMSPLDLFAGADKALLAERIHEVFDKGISQVEADLVAKDGTRTPYFFTGLAAVIDGRRHLVGMGLDVSNQKQAEARLLESERHYRMLFEANPHPMWVYDQETLGFLAVNEAAILHYGYSRKEFAALTIRDIRPEEEQARLQENLAGHRETIQHSGTWKHRKKDGTIILVEITSHSLDFSGRPARLVLCHDVTHRVALEERLLQAQNLETIGMIAGGVAHEVRNPLFAITTLVAALEKKLRGQTDLGGFVAHIQNETRRLNDLMADLLSLGRVLDKSQFIAVDLRSVLTSTKDLITAGGTDTSACEMTFPGEALVVAGASDRLAQVFANLGQNALAFSPPGGKVRVRAWRERGEACVAFSDDGPGLPSDLLPRLFTPFASRRKGGTGLGLAIVHKIVTLHGGTVAGRNNEDGPGAVFTVRLPLAGGRTEP